MTGRARHICGFIANAKPNRANAATSRCSDGSPREQQEQRGEHEERRDDVDLAEDAAVEERPRG